MSDINHRHGTGSALLDQLHAERCARRALWSKAAKERVRPVDAPFAVVANVKSLGERLKEAEAISLNLPYDIKRKIRWAILKSAEDCGEKKETAPNPKPAVDIVGKPTIFEIQKMIAWHFNVSLDDILSARRNARLVRPRQIAMYFAKLLASCSISEIGRRFGGRDHTTVLHGVRKITALVETDKELAEEIAALTKVLLS